MDFNDLFDSNQFNLEIYKNFNNDLKKFSNSELIYHFKTFGINENGRVFNFKTLINHHPLLKYFDIDYYICKNTDLKFLTKNEYIMDYLNNRLNENREISEQLTKFKNLKKKLLIDKLMYLNENDDLNYLEEEEKTLYKIGINESESANEWGDDSDISDLIKNNEIVLNIGAGYRTNKDRYFSLENVINTEIFAYPTTDVLCNGDKLPFKDNSFDVVLSLAVLEHVKNPWIHAQEIIRVLKPGGIIYADVPFLQPYHGYPHHYYNMTTAGLRNLFDKKIQIIKHEVENWQKPIYTLTWFLNRYCEFLDEETRNTFKKLTVEEIINNGNGLERTLDYVINMDKTKEEIIAAGTTLIGKKI